MATFTELGIFVHVEHARTVAP